MILVSPTPPPAGGIATWTETLLRRGLPAPWSVRLVDSRLVGRTIADKSTPVARELLRTSRVLWSLSCLLVKRPRNVLHVNASLSRSGVFRDWACVTLGRAFRVAVIVNLRGEFRVPAGRGPMVAARRMAYRGMFGMAAVVVPLTRASALEVLRLGDFTSKLKIVPNFIDGAALPERRADKSTGTEFIAVFVGALVPAKGVDTIIEAAALTRDVRFVLVGDADDRQYKHLKERIIKHGLENRVSLNGSLPHERVIEVVRSASVFVFPSKTEGFPVSVAEAMAVGLPVVASPVGAIPDMIDEGKGGFLVRHDEPERYAEAISKLQAEPALVDSMGKYNRTKALREYDFPIVIKRWIEIYERVCHAGSTSSR